MMSKVFSPEKRNSLKPILWIFSNSKSSMKYYIPGMFFTSFQNFIFGYIVSAYVKNICDIITGVQKGNLSYIGILFVSVFIGSDIVYNIGRFLMSKAVHNIEHNLRCRLFLHLSNLPSDYYDKHHSGEISSYIINDLNNLNSLYSSNFTDIISQIVTIMGSLIVIYKWEWHLGIVYTLFALTSFIFSKKLLKKVEYYTKENLNAVSEINERIIDIISGMRELRMYDLKDIIFNKYVKSNQKGAKLSIEKSKINAELKGISVFYLTAGFAGIIVIGFILVERGITTVGTVMGIAIFVYGYIWVYRAIISAFSSLISGLSAGNRIIMLLQQPVEEDQKAINNKINTGKNDEFNYDNQYIINIKNIKFSYENKLVLNDISLNIKRGEVLGIAGKSGAGKSTLLKLIAGLYVLKSGNIYINGNAFSDMTFNEWRQYFSYVPQDTFIFMGTVFDNIALAKPQSSKDEVINAAKAAFADDFIRKLPDGYDTMIGKGGRELSVGERQRIAIARAFLKNAPILLLDEPTASLDSVAEYQIEYALRELMKGRTTIMVSHRLSTLAIADEIVVINDGNIVERGLFKELMEDGKIYNEILERQAI